MALPPNVATLLGAAAFGVEGEETKKKKPRKPLHIYACEAEISTNAIAHLNKHWGLDSHRLHSIVALSENNTLAACGNTLLFLDLKSKSIEVVPGENRGGIGAICRHPTRNIYVVCDKYDQESAHPQQSGALSKEVSAKVRLFDYPSRNVIQTLESVPAVRGYSVCSFNQAGDILATVAIEPDFVLTLWNWEKGEIVLRNKAAGNEVYSVYFSAFNPGVLTTSGLGHIKFWQMAETFTGLKLKGSVGRFGRIDICDVTAFVQLPDGKVLSGSESGYLLLWEGSMIKCQFGRKMENSDDTRCHNGRIDVVQLIEGGQFFMTAGADGYIRYWPFHDIDFTEATGGLELSHATCLREVFLGETVSVRCMSLTPSRSFWMILDANGSIRRIPYESKMTITSTATPSQVAPLHHPAAPLLEAQQSYFTFAAGALKCIAAHPSKHCSVVGGADGYLRLVDHLQMKIVCQTKVPDCSINSVQFIPHDATQRLIICGCSDGTVRTFRLCPNTFETISQQRPHSTAVVAVAVDEAGKQVYSFAVDTEAEINSAFYLSLDPASGVLTPFGFCRLPFKPTSACEWDPEGKACFVGSHTGEIIALEPAPQNNKNNNNNNNNNNNKNDNNNTTTNTNNHGDEYVIDNFEFKGRWAAVALRQRKKRPPKAKKTTVRASKNTDDDFDVLDAGELMAAFSKGGGGGANGDQQESSSDDDDLDDDVADQGPWAVNSITRFPKNGPKQVICGETDARGHGDDDDHATFAATTTADGDLANLDEEELEQRRREKMRREQEMKELEAAQQKEPGIVVVAFGKEELCYEFRTTVRYGENATKPPPLPKTGLEPPNWVEEPGRNFAFRNSVVEKTVFSPSGKTMVQIFDHARVGVRDMTVVASIPLVQPVGRMVHRASPAATSTTTPTTATITSPAHKTNAARGGGGGGGGKQAPQKEPEINDHSFGFTSQLHDGLHGHITGVAVSYDDSLVISVGDDGAVFSQLLDACQRKVRPFDHKPLSLSDWAAAQNPAEPSAIALSIQAQKLKDDADRATEAAMSKKDRILKKIHTIHAEFAKILEANDAESGGRRLERDELSLSEFLRERLNRHLHDRVADAKKELNWVSAKKKAHLDKLKAKYIDVLQYDAFCVRPFDTTRAPVKSFRTSIMTQTQKKHLDAINQLIGVGNTDNQDQDQDQNQTQQQQQQQLQQMKEAESRLANNTSPGAVSNTSGTSGHLQQGKNATGATTTNNNQNDNDESSQQRQKQDASGDEDDDEDFGSSPNNRTTSNQDLAVQFGQNVHDFDHHQQQQGNNARSLLKDTTKLDTSAQVRSQLEKAEERRREREERRAKLQTLLASNPKNQPEDPQVLHAIHRAERRMGDYILKSSDDFKIPDHLRPTADRKAKQLALLEHSANQIRAEFNSRLLALRDRKKDLCKELNQDRRRIVEICNILKVDLDVDEFKLFRDELPEEEFDFDDQTLLSWEDANIKEQQRKEANERAKRGFGSDLAAMDDGKSASMNVSAKDDHSSSSQANKEATAAALAATAAVGGASTTSASNKESGGESKTSEGATGADPTQQDADRSSSKATTASVGATTAGTGAATATSSTTASATVASAAATAASAAAAQQQRRPGGTVLTAKEKFEQDLRVRLEGIRRSEVEIEESLVQRERLLFERQRLTRKIQKSVRAFDTELRDRLRERTSIEADLLMADMRALLLFNEYLKLIAFRLQDEQLAHRLEEARAEKKEVVQRSRNCSDRVLAKTKEIDGLRKSLETLRMQFIQMQQQAPEQVQKALDRIFFKKLKRRRADDDLEDDDVTSSDEDENEADDEYADDGEPDQCPPGCDEELFLAIIALRERRLDCDDALAEFTKAAHALRKEHDGLVQREAAADSKLALVEADIQKFQHQKQRELNSLDTVVVLKMSQVQCLRMPEKVLPDNLDHPDIIVFRRANLRSLVDRIGVLDREKGELNHKLSQMQTHKSQAGRKRTKAVAQMTEWEGKVYEVQLLKFGQRVNLELLENIAVDRESEELKSQLKMEEVFWEREVLKQDERLLEFRQGHQQRIAENTSHLKHLGSLRAEQYEIEQDLGTSLDRVVSKMSGGSKVATAEDRQRLRDLIVAQQRDIDALKSEVAMLRRKGGYVYTPVVNQVQAQSAVPQHPASAGGH